MSIEVLEKRRPHVARTGGAPVELACDKQSVAGSVSQRACVFCGSRVVLYPIADALHLIHGPVGCAAYTWDIRGAESTGPQLHRMSFSTDLREPDVIYGGAEKLRRAAIELIERYQPKAAFIYSTCIVGLIGDDVDAICRQVSEATGVETIPVHSEGFAGSKKDGYTAACRAIGQLVGTGDISDVPRNSINILGDFNIAGETEVIRDYYERMGLNVIATITGDGRVDDIRKSHGAALNVVQCSGSMKQLAAMMKDKYDIPFIHVSYFGIEDMSQALYDVAEQINDRDVTAKAQAIVRGEIQAILPRLRELRKGLEGKRAAVYTGGAFKAFSLVRSLRTLGMSTVIAGSQTGSKAEYQKLATLCDPDTVLLDDTNPLELAKFMQEKDVDLLIGGVKERPIAYKLGVAFCDHNHERKQCLAGYAGMVNFAEEVHRSVCTPVWDLVRPRRVREAAAKAAQGSAAAAMAQKAAKREAAKRAADAASTPTTRPAANPAAKPATLTVGMTGGV